MRGKADGGWIGRIAPIPRGMRVLRPQARPCKAPCHKLLDCKEVYSWAQR